MKNLSNTVIANEIMSQCPVWFTSARGACVRVSKPFDFKIKTPLLCQWLQLWHSAKKNKLSAVTHRISAILIHSGAKTRSVLFVLHNAFVLYSVFGKLKALLFAKTNNWNIRLFPKTSGSTLKTSLLWEAYPQLHIHSRQIKSEVNRKRIQINVVHLPARSRILFLLWKWYGVRIFLLRYECHLMTGCVKIKPIGIFRCWKNESFGKADSRIFLTSLPSLVSTLAPDLSFTPPRRLRSTLLRSNKTNVIKFILKQWDCEPEFSASDGICSYVGNSGL